MTVWLTRTYVAALGLKEAVREYWKRIAVGALCGWLIASVLGAIAVVGFESAHLITAGGLDPARRRARLDGHGSRGHGRVRREAHPVERRTSDR